VPLNYARPTAKQIDIAVLKVAATSKSKRIGVLLVNPGGPGSSGVDFALNARRLLGSAITQRFDIIGFDPRGVARSQQADCLSDNRLDAYIAVDPTPDDEAERDQLRAVSEELAKGCGDAVGVDVLPHLGTLDAARDMEQIRKALGESTISMMGFSYGTLLGATYAELFPKQVRAFVLDGALDSRSTSDDRSRIQAEGFEAVFQAYVADCSNRPSCRGVIRRDPAASIDKVLAAVEISALPTKPAGKRSVGPGEAMLGLVRALYSKRSGWPRLDEAIVAALLSNDGTKLLALADDYSNRRPNGSFDGILESNVAVNCIDSGVNRDVTYYDRFALELTKVSPRFGATIAYGSMACAYWPVPALSTEGWQTKAAGSAPILVIGTTNDPATPYVWAEDMAAQLENGVLLTNVGDSHTAYFSGGPCIQGAVENYLVKLKVPPKGKRCNG
jgi:pimeloyl-ACP methyl ester carboxylesterase